MNRIIQEMLISSACVVVYFHTESFLASLLIALANIAGYIQGLDRGFDMAKRIMGREEA